VFDGAAVHRDAVLAGHPAALYVGQIKNYAGQPISVMVASAQLKRNATALFDSVDTFLAGLRDAG
jgi:hypothetical protein